MLVELSKVLSPAESTSVNFLPLAALFERAVCSENKYCVPEIIGPLARTRNMPFRAVVLDLWRVPAVKQVDGRLFQCWKGRL